jgi:CubicO group peptidase (beta-lactamase class C family)
LVKTTMMMKVGAAVLACAMQPVPCAAQTDPAVSALAEGLFSKWSGPGTPGCAVAALRDGKAVLTRAWGQADLEHGIANSPQTVFEAGSVSKQFTSAAMLLLARDGKLALSDDVRKYVPELPDYGNTITLEHLLTHTSGLRDWGTLLDVAGWPRGTRVFSMKQALALVARQRTLNFAPGSRYSYSNTGYVLAAIIIGRVSGKSLGEFTRERLFVPLGMKHTQWRDNFRRVVADRAVAYHRTDGGYEQDMPFEDVVGHGGMLTTVGDLLIWNDALAHDRLGTTIAAQLEQRTSLPAGQVSQYGRGLSVRRYRGALELSHDGSTAGYRTWLGRYPEQGLSIAVLCNADDARPHRMGRVIAQHILGLPADSATVAHAVVPSASQEHAGTFYSELLGQRLTLSYRDGALILPDGTALRVLGANSYGYKTAVLTFDGVDQLLVEDESLDPARYRRVVKVASDPAALAAFSGRYYSDEVQAGYVVSVGDGMLAFRFQDNPDYQFDLAPLGPDLFGGDDKVVRFKRDAAGRVVGASVATDGVFDLPFQKEN